MSEKRDDIRPKGTVEVQCSTPNCGWAFWVPNDDARLPEGPFFCDTCAEHARYEFVCSHRQDAAAFLADVDNPRSILRFTLESLRGTRLRVTVEKILPGGN